MSRLPYFPLYPSDFEAKTSHLTISEDGAYNRLLRICWMTPGCSMPADEEWIMRRCRAFSDADREAVSTVLSEFFKVKDGRYSNDRLSEIFEETSAAHKKRVKAGSKGGRAKAMKTNNTKPSNATAEASNATAMPKQPEPEPEPYNTVPYGTDAEGVQEPEIDLPSEPETDHQKATNAVWQRGPAFLAERGVSQGSARSVIGKWLKGSKPQDVFDALADAKKCGTQDPVAYITKALHKPEITGADISDMVSQIIKEMPKK